MEGFVRDGAKVAANEIFSKLGVHDLLRVAEVCKSFYAVSRSNDAWKRHYKRFVEKFPYLVEQGFFGKNNKSGSMANVSKKAKRKLWVTPAGYWKTFAKKLCIIPKGTFQAYYADNNLAWYLKNRLHKIKGNSRDSIIVMIFYMVSELAVQPVISGTVNINRDPRLAEFCTKDYTTNFAWSRKAKLYTNIFIEFAHTGNKQTITYTHHYSVYCVMTHFYNFLYEEEIKIN